MGNAHHHNENSLYWPRAEVVFVEGTLDCLPLQETNASFPSSSWFYYGIGSWDEGPWITRSPWENIGPPRHKKK